jgi:hypothetical protein
MKFRLFFSLTKWFGTEFRALSSSMERFETKVLRAFLFYEMVRNEILNFFYLPWNGLERNSNRFQFRETDKIQME